MVSQSSLHQTGCPFMGVLTQQNEVSFEVGMCHKYPPAPTHLPAVTKAGDLRALGEDRAVPTSPLQAAAIPRVDFPHQSGSQPGQSPSSSGAVGPWEVQGRLPAMGPDTWKLTDYFMNE